MTEFKPDMSWRNEAEAQQGPDLTENEPVEQLNVPSDDASTERSAESAAERLQRLRSGRSGGPVVPSSVGNPADGQSRSNVYGQADGFAQQRLRQQPPRQPSERTVEREPSMISHLGGPRALIVIGAVVVIALVAAFAVVGGVGDVSSNDGEAAQSSAVASNDDADREESEKSTSTGLVDVDAITDDTLHNLLADYDNNDDGQLTQEEIQRITQLVVNDEVTDFTPIAPLDKLDTLSIDTLGSQKADFSKLENLEVLKFGDVTTQDLDLSVCSKLNAFKVTGLKGGIDSIDASGLKNLMFFTVDKDTQGDVEKIDLSNNDMLGALEITCNVGELNLSGCSHSFPKLNITADHIDKIVVDDNTNVDLVSTLRDLCSQKGWTLEER